MTSYLLEAKFFNSRWNNEKQVDDKIKVDQKMEGEVSDPTPGLERQCRSVRHIQPTAKCGGSFGTAEKYRFLF